MTESASEILKNWPEDKEWTAVNQLVLGKKVKWLESKKKWSEIAKMDFKWY